MEEAAMNKTRTTRITLMLIFFFLFTACKSPITFITNSNNPTATGIPANPTGEPTVNSEIPPAATVDPKPVGIQDGLGSLDSYQLTFHLISTDSKGNKTDVNEVTERSVVDRNTHSITTTVMFDPENDTEESRETQETYSIGLERCSNSGDGWEYKTVTEQEKEMADVFSNLVDVSPLINNPEFIGEEVINGVNTNHFTFKIEGIGDRSGSVATINSGDYWLAKDGQYIVKYHLILQIRSAAEGVPDAEVANIEALLDLVNINVPLSFTMPADCHP
jgi:hypothetical protein